MNRGAHKALSMRTFARVWEVRARARGPPDPFPQFNLFYSWISYIYICMVQKFLCRSGRLGGGSAGHCAPARPCPLKIATFARRLLPRQCRNRRAHDSGPAFSTVQWSVYSRIHTFVSRVAAKAEPSRFGSRCWCDITPALNTSKPKGKQTKKQKQTNESKVVIM